MRDRAKSLERVLAVQNQMVKMAEWKLAALTREGQALKADQALLHAFVTGSEPLSPLLSQAAFARGQHLQGAVARSEAAAAAQSTHLDTMRRREKLAEKLADQAKAVADRHAEHVQLRETIEVAAQRGDASFP